MNNAKPILFFVLSLIFLTITACNNEVDKAQNNAQKAEVIELGITQSDIEAIRFDEFELSPAAQKATAEWDGFQEIASSVEFIKTGDLTFFKSDIEEVKEAVQKCRIFITKELNTNPIMSRLTVVETTFLKLQNDLTLDNIPKEEQLKSIEEVFIAWSNLVYIINKKFEFEATDVDRPQ